MVDSFAAPQHVIELPDDDEEAPLRPMGRRGRSLGRKAPTGKITQTTSVPEPVVQQIGDLNGASVTFADPMSTERLSASTAQDPASSVPLHTLDPQTTLTIPPSSLFVTHHVPEDQASAAKEAIRQASLMMERMKTVRETSQVAYDASAALQANVQVS